MNVLISHPTGNANVRAITRSFAESGKLESFYTSLASFPNSLWGRVAGLPGFAELKRRSFEDEINAFTHTYPWFELGRMISQKSGIKGLTKHESGFFCVDKVYHALDRHVAGRLSGVLKKNLNVVYAYEDGALETFRAAKRQGLTCVYELPIAYWKTSRHLLLQEAQRLPEWAPTLAGGITDSQQKLNRKTEELDLADIVVTPGSFVANSVKDFTKNKKVIISPFGSPSNPKPIKKTVKANRPLRVLFVGSMSQRKGLSDLFEAVNMLGHDDIELVVMGSPVMDLSFYKRHLTFSYEPTRAHPEVLDLMRTCDVFCLPSIVEGRALVMQEAMSQGLPIIITPNTGGEDLVIEGHTGFTVPIRSPWAIAEKLQWFIDNKHRIEYMGICAQKHASGYSWDKYAANIILEIENFLLEKAL